MTGPEHYRTAEALLRACADPAGSDVDDLGVLVPYYPANDDGQDVCSNALAAAQVHATLALAAATIEPIAATCSGPDDTTIQLAWAEAIS